MAAGRVELRWLKAGVLEMAWSGVPDGAVVAAGEARVVELCARGEQVDCVVMDTLRVETYRADVSGPAASLLSCLRRRGLVELVLLSTSSAIRMMAGTLAFAARLKLVTLADRAALDAHLAKRVPAA